jgi:hypothetical protein
MIAVGAAGGVTGSTIFRAQDAPMYLPGMWYVYFEIYILDKKRTG